MITVIYKLAFISTLYRIQDTLTFGELLKLKHLTYVGNAVNEINSTWDKLELERYITGQVCKIDKSLLSNSYMIPTWDTLNIGQSVYICNKGDIESFVLIENWQYDLYTTNKLLRTVEGIIFNKYMILLNRDTENTMQYINKIKEVVNA